MILLFQDSLARNVLYFLEGTDVVIEIPRVCTRESYASSPASHLTFLRFPTQRMNIFVNLAYKCDVLHSEGDLYIYLYSSFLACHCHYYIIVAMCKNF